MSHACKTPEGCQQLFSPRSGRTKIAQRFIAGNEVIFFKTSPRSGRQKPSDSIFANEYFCRPFHGLYGINRADSPAVNCWAIFDCPLRGLAEPRLPSTNSQSVRSARLA